MFIINDNRYSSDSELNGQDPIINLMKKINIHTDEEGICYGISCVLMCYLLIEEGDNYINDLLDSIYDDVDLDELSTEIVQSSKDDEKLLELLEIRAFMECISICQFNSEYKYLLNNEKHLELLLEEIDEVLSLIIPKKIELQGGIKRYKKTFCGSYTNEELMIYFSCWSKAIKNNKNDFNSSIPIVLLIHSIDHAIIVAFNHKIDQWVLIDPNNLPDIHYGETADIDTLVSFSTNNISVFSTTVYCTSSNEKTLNEVIIDLENQKVWQNMHKINAERCNRVDSNQANLLHLAVSYRYNSFLKEAIQLTDNDLNLLYKAKSLLYLAFEYNYPAIEILMKKLDVEDLKNTAQIAKNLNNIDIYDALNLKITNYNLTQNNLFNNSKIRKERGYEIEDQNQSKKIIVDSVFSNNLN